MSYLVQYERIEKGSPKAVFEPHKYDQVKEGAILWENDDINRLLKFLDHTWQYAQVTNLNITKVA
jgi:hypothetical protein